MKLLALVLQLFSFSALTLTEVVDDFNKECSSFFIKGPENEPIAPTVLNGDQFKMICQRWKNQYRYATLYDTKQRIPVYSAYTFTEKHESIEEAEWKNEPQLENRSYTADMKKILVDEMDEYSHQAVNRDYSESQQNTNPNTKYTRGHVYPKQYAADQDQADSTFTFTNVAPQTQYSNEQWAKQIEQKMKNEIKTKCKPNVDKTNVVTGVIPGNNCISIKRNKPVEDCGINIPEYFWTAYCCINGKDNRISKAYLALQNELKKETYEFTEMSVDRMNHHLTIHYKQPFKVFGDLCVT